MYSPNDCRPAHDAIKTILQLENHHHDAQDHDETTTTTTMRQESWERTNLLRCSSRINHCRDESDSPRRITVMMKESRLCQLQEDMRRRTRRPHNNGSTSLHFSAHHLCTNKQNRTSRPFFLLTRNKGRRMNVCSEWQEKLPVTSDRRRVFLVWKTTVVVLSSQTRKSSHFGSWCGTFGPVAFPGSLYQGFSYSSPGFFFLSLALVSQYRRTLWE
jgi:hypothetical protein